MEVWALLVRISHCLHARGEVSAMVPALRAAWIRWLSAGISDAAAKLFFGVLNGTTISDPESVNFSCDPENWAYGEATSESTAKDIIPARIGFPARAAIVPLLDWLPARVADDICNLENPEALGDDSSFCAVTQQQWRACVRRMLRCKLARVPPPSSLDPRLVSGAFAVVKDENRNRFNRTTPAHDFW